jgi:hypothetical protein
MAIPYKTKKEAWDKRRSDEVTVIDQRTNRYYNMKKKSYKSRQGSKKLTWKDLVIVKS